LADRGRPWPRIASPPDDGRDCVSAVVFGPNGSGKTTSLIVPNVLNWDGPVVLTTAKPQDLEPLCTARSARGPVWVIAPGGAPGHTTVGWSPIDAASLLCAIVYAREPQKRHKSVHPEIQTPVAPTLPIPHLTGTLPAEPCARDSNP
jgi:hypothetical protein